MHEEIAVMIRKYYDDWFEINKTYSVWAKKHNISQKSLFVLYEILNHKGKCTQALICEHTSYQKQTVSQIISTFENQGLIRREINVSDKRNRFITFTPEGEAYASMLMDELMETEVDAFLRLSPKEQKTVVDGLHLLARVLEKSFSKESNR